MKKILFVLSLLLVSACSSSDSDSGGMVSDTLPGTNIPAIFAGVYTGTLNIRASALGLTESDSFPITITVTEDGMIRFDGDDPEETFTVGLADDGTFSGSFPVDEEECSGTVGTEGNVDGVNASGFIAGSGVCVIDGLTVDVTFDGDFAATK